MRSTLPKTLRPRGEFSRGVDPQTSAFHPLPTLGPAHLRACEVCNSAFVKWHIGKTKLLYDRGSVLFSGARRGVLSRVQAPT
jgi:hypothetical protein